MTISSRTPEGESRHCPVCGKVAFVDPSLATGDALCPTCGSLTWGRPARRVGDDSRKKVLALAREIEVLARPETEEHIFFPAFLHRLLTAIGAPAGMIWINSRDGMPLVRAAQGLESTGYSENVDAALMSNSLLMNVRQHRRTLIFGAGELTTLPIPTNHLYVVTPLMVGRDCLGFVEALLRATTDPRARSGYMQFIEQMSGYAGRYLYQRQSRT